MQRRQLLGYLGASTVAAGVAPWASAAGLQRVAIAVPGPGNLHFLPLALALKTGSDVAQGIQLDIRYVGGGPQAFQQMLDRNTDFSVGGLPALGLQKASGNPVVSVAPITRVPAYTLLVRKQFERSIKSIRDLSGQVLGVKGHVPGGRSTTQLITEFVLRQAGVAPDKVNFVAVGQSFDSQHAALASGTVDAIMGDEPFATRLIKEKVAFALADFHDLGQTRKLMGGLFLNGQLCTRDDFIASKPDLVGKVVRTITRTLVWIHTHSAQDIVSSLALEDGPERRAWLDVLAEHKNIYSPDGKFVPDEINTTNRFLHAVETGDAVAALDLSSIVNSRWAGQGV